MPSLDRDEILNDHADWVAWERQSVGGRWSGRPGANRSFRRTKGSSAMRVPSVRELSERPAVRYLAVGALSFVVDLTLLAVLHEYWGVPAGIAAGLAFAASFAVNYSLQKAFAFGSRGAHGRALPRYVALVVGNLLFTALVVEAAVLVGWPWVVGKVIATGIVTAANFFLYGAWVFAGPVRDREADRV